MREILTNDDDFSGEYFQKLRNDSYDKGGGVSAEWMSWKSISDKHGAELAKAFVQQNTIKTRPHAKLDPSAESTLALPVEQRFQYKDETEKEHETYSTTFGQHVKTGGNATEDLEAAPGAPLDDVEYDALRKNSLKEARKGHNSFASVDIDFRQKLKQFENNGYKANYQKPNQTTKTYK